MQVHALIEDNIGARTRTIKALFHKRHVAEAERTRLQIDFIKKIQKDFNPNDYFNRKVFKPRKGSQREGYEKQIIKIGILLVSKEHT